MTAEGPLRNLRTSCKNPPSLLQERPQEEIVSLDEWLDEWLEKPGRLLEYREEEHG